MRQHPVVNIHLVATALAVAAGLAAFSGQAFLAILMLIALAVTLAG